MTSPVEEIEREELAKLFGGFAWMRALVLPLPMAILAYAAFSDPAWWRRIIVFGVMIAAPTVALGELLRFRRSGMGRIRHLRTIGVAGCAHLGMCALTGGVESPFLFGLIPMALLVGAMMEKFRATFFLLQLSALWLMACAAIGSWSSNFVPRLFGGGARAGHNDNLVALQVTLLTVGLCVIYVMSAQLRRGFDLVVARMRQSREEALAAHAGEKQALTALSAEIAHELKNPLASVKGLAALMAPELEGKNGERLGVLRREVDRMQAILDELLDFSRPLGTLTKQPAELVDLCRQVVDLHEGMWRAAGISVEVRGPDQVMAPCDARKVKQILINLLQNAIEASSAGSEIAIEIEPGSKIRILDRGSGLDSSLKNRVFEAGATTKAKGNGLGLTIARALARQHGGELTLGDRPGGGAAAELSLPA